MIDKEIFDATIAVTVDKDTRDALKFYRDLDIQPAKEPKFTLAEFRDDAGLYTSLEVPYKKVRALMADAKKKSPEVAYIARMFVFAEKYSKLRYAFACQWHDRHTRVYLGEHKEQLIRFFDEVYDHFIIMGSNHADDKEEHFRRAMTTDSEHHSDILTEWVCELRDIALYKLSRHYTQTEINNLGKRKSK